jgi:hypothetical protein
MKTSPMIGTYPTLDGELTVKFNEVTDDPNWTDFQDIEYFEDADQVTCAWLVQKYGREAAERFILGAIRNAKEI